MADLHHTSPNKKKRSRSDVSSATGADETSAAKRLKLESFVPTLAIILGEEPDYSSAYLVLHKSQEKATEFFQWLSDLHHILACDVIMAAATGEELSTSTGNTLDLLKKSFDITQRRKWSPAQMEKNKEKLKIFDQQESQEDFLGRWFHQKKVSFGKCVPEPLVAQVLSFDLTKLKLVFLPGFC